MSYVCVHCSSPSPTLFKTTQSNDVILLTRCSSCLRFSDPNIESPPLLLLLQSILHKPSVYKHLLFNRYPDFSLSTFSGVRLFAKATMATSILDAYLYHESLFQKAQHSPPAMLFAAALLSNVSFTLAIILSGLLVLKIFAPSSARTRDATSLLYLCSALPCLLKLATVLLLIWSPMDVIGAPFEYMGIGFTITPACFCTGEVLVFSSQCVCVANVLDVMHKNGGGARREAPWGAVAFVVLAATLVRALVEKSVSDVLDVGLCSRVVAMGGFCI